MKLHQFLRVRKVFIIALFLALPLAARALDQPSANALATHITAATGRSNVLISVPNCGSGALVFSFWNQNQAQFTGGRGTTSKLLVDGFDPSLTNVAAAQASATANLPGVLGHNIYLRSGSLSTVAYSMPYANNLVDLVVVTNLQDSDLSNISYAEMERVLCNSGQAWIGRATAESGGTLTTGSLTAWLSGTHALSTGTVVSDSTGTWAVITKISRLPNTYEGGGSMTNAGCRFYPDYAATWPTLPQWTAKPWGLYCTGMYGSGITNKISDHGSFTNICVGGGRMYGYDDVGLCALRAQNGLLLWQRADLTGGGWGGANIEAFSKGVVVSGSLMIDGETGVTTGTIPIPSNWKPGSSWQPTTSFQVDNSTATKDILYAVGTGSDGINTLLAYDLVNKATLYTVPNFADNNAISAFYACGMLAYQLNVVFAGGKLYVCTGSTTSSGTSIYCYNTADGSKAWGPISLSGSAINNIEASPNGVLVQVGSGNSVSLYFLAVADGSIKWGPKTSTTLAYNYYCDIATIPTLNSGKEAICTIGGGAAMDLLTSSTNGNTIGFYGSGHCNPGASMTPAGFFSRRDGIGYSMALRANVNSSDPWASDCTDAPFAANGMIITKAKWYNCSCYGLFRGTSAQAPLGSFNPEQTAVQAERLQQGPAYGNNLNATVNPDTNDWPTHRANNNRSASTSATLSTTKLVQCWKYTNPTPNNYNYTVSGSDDFYTYQDVTPPVTAGNYLTGCYTYLAGADGVVKCLDNNNNGNLVWSYATGGWIFATPTLANGCVYIGSGDGYAYCLEAQTGRLVWRFRAAPTERRFNYYGHLISTWPILTGVMVHPNGNAYFASGMMDEYGVQVFAVNALTGTMVWQNTSAGVSIDNRPGLARVGHMPGGYITALGNQLFIKEGTHAYSNALQKIDVYDLNTGAISPNDFSFLSNRQNSTGRIWTGRQIGVMGNFIFNFGEDIHTEMDREQYGGATNIAQVDSLGNPVHPFLGLNVTWLQAMAWDANEAFMESTKYIISGSGGLTQSLQNSITAGQTTVTNTNSAAYCTSFFAVSQPSSSIAQWKPVTTGSYANSGTNRAMALTSNCLVQLSGSGDIFVLDRMSGTQYFHVNTGGESYFQGMAIDRSGKIIAVNRNGDVVCFGSPDATIISQPQNVAGVEAGQPASFSVEAAGTNLTYQWQFNGSAIAGATNATYSIASVSDSNAGVYNCVVSNTNSSATSLSALLATAVTANLTSPINNSIIAQPGDAQSPNITLNASASSLHGAISKVEFYANGTLIGTGTSAPYTFTWTAAPTGTSTITAKAYDSLGKTGNSQPVSIIVSALMLHYPFDGNTNDTSGHGNNGTIHYSPTWTSQSLFNGGMVSNSNVWVSTPTLSSLSGTGYTISAWFNCSNLNVHKGFIWAGGSNAGGCIASYGSGNYSTLTWFTTSGSKVVSGANSPITFGIWYNYTLVVTPSLISWYVNGALFNAIQPPTGQTFVLSNKAFTFCNGDATSVPRTAYGLDGTIDEARIYDQPLPATEVAALYTTYIPYQLPMPTIALTSPTDGQIVTATNSLTMSAIVSGSHWPAMVRYYSSGTLLGTGTVAPNYNFTWSNVARGTYVVTGTVTDGLGQVAASGTSNVTFSYVSAPVLSLQGGAYNNAQNVTITCSDTSAVIHYTTTGLDPTTSDPVVASGSAIPITKTTVLKVQAFKDGNQPSEVQTMLYRIGPGLAAGAYSSYAIIPGAPLWVWGYNSYNGQLGDGTTTDRAWPECIGNMNNLIAVSGGGWGYHALAVDVSGSVWGWGYNYYGQIGDGSTTTRTSPVKLSGISNVLSVSAGEYHSLAMKWDGTVWAWGFNGTGQVGCLGSGTQKTPVQVLATGSVPLTSIVAVAAGNSHSLALKSDGTVWSWGYNDNGQLGYSTGTATSGSMAIQVTGLTGTVTAIAAGSGFSVALKNDGTVWVWGDNTYGQLGNGSAATSSTTPVQVSGLTNVAAIACNSESNHILALKNDGTVWGWGNNSMHQLGDGTTNNHTTPFQIAGLSNMVAVAGGIYHSMALGSDGSLWAWGYNGNGQLGSGTTGNTVTAPTASISSTSAMVTFTGTAQTVSESSPPFPFLALLFCPAASSISVPLSISGSAVKNTDYTISGSTVLISAGQTSGSITISPINDNLYKNSRTIILKMGTVSGATIGISGTDTITITDDDPKPMATFTTGTAFSTEASGTVQIPVQLSAPAGVVVTVPFTVGGAAASGTDYTMTVGGTSVTTSGTVSIAAGGTTANITVVLNHRSGYQGDRSLTLSMGTPTNATIGSIAQETFTITDVDPKPITITTPVANQTVPWGQPATFSVVVDGSSPAYQWYKNGTAIIGATNANYTTPATVITDKGAVFSVTATNVVSSASSSGILSVTCFDPPQVSICNPIGDATLYGPLNLNIQLDVQSPGIASIQFYLGSTLLGQITSGSAFTWNNVPVGSYALTAVIADTQGQSTTSAPVYITVSAPAFFDDWIAAHSLTGSQALDCASPAGDHISNLLKYALGLDPNTPCTKPTDGTNPGLPLLGSNAGNLTLTFQQDTAKSDIAYTAEASSDMVNWSPTSVTLAVTGSNGTINTVKASIPKTSNKQFLRLKVTK